MPNKSPVKKVQIRSPKNKSALARVYAEALDEVHGLVDDLEDELDEDEDEFVDYTESESDEREEREKGKARAKIVQDLIDEINEINREIHVQGSPMVSTPVAAQYSDMQVLSQEEHDDAVKKLPREREAVTKALAQAKLDSAERALGVERAAAVQPRIEAIFKTKRQIVEAWEGKAPDTPCAVQYRGQRSMSTQEAEDAATRLQLEEAAVQKALDLAIEEADARDGAWMKAHEDGLKRAKTIQSRIIKAYDARRKAILLADDLGLEMDQGEDYDEYGAASLTTGEFDAVTIRLDAEKLRFETWEKRLGGAKWTLDQMTNLVGPALDARNALDAALLTRDPVPGEAGTWIKTLNAHALTREKEIDEQQVADDMAAFYENTNKGLKQPVRSNLPLMAQFAKEYEHSDEKTRLESYKKVYQALLNAERVTTVPPRDGRVPLPKLNSVLPSGTTAGQRYTVDQSKPSGDAFGSYDYHLSVGFTLRVGKNGQPTMATIVQAHVSFKRQYVNNAGKVINQDKKYWYRINNGTFTFNNPTGGAVQGDGLHTTADALLRAKAPKLNCTF